MKRMIKVLLILAATVAAVAALAITAGATELKTGIGIVEASGGLRLRSQASTSSDILSTAHNGDNVVVIRQVGDWYLVNYNLKIGYMHSDYITFKERENIELGYGSVDPPHQSRWRPHPERQDHPRCGQRPRRRSERRAHQEPRAVKPESAFQRKGKRVPRQATPRCRAPVSGIPRRKRARSRVMAPKRQSGTPASAGRQGWRKSIFQASSVILRGSQGAAVRQSDRIRRSSE